MDNDILNTEDKAKKEKINWAIENVLSYREREIIKLRYGIGNGYNTH